MHTSFRFVGLASSVMNVGAWKGRRRPMAATFRERARLAHLASKDPRFGKGWHHLSAAQQIVFAAATVFERCPHVHYYGMKNGPVVPIYIGPLHGGTVVISDRSPRPSKAKKPKERLRSRKNNRARKNLWTLFGLGFIAAAGLFGR